VPGPAPIPSLAGAKESRGNIKKTLKKFRLELKAVTEMAAGGNHGPRRVWALSRCLEKEVALVLNMKDLNIKIF